MSALSNFLRRLFGGQRNKLVRPRPPLIRGQLNVDYRPTPDTSQFPFFINNIVDWKATFLRPSNSGKLGVYYALGEVLPTEAYFNEIKALGIPLLGQNATWGSYYIDVRDPRWGDLLIKLLGQSYATGKFNFVFFDTADTYWALNDIMPGHLDEFITATAAIMNKVKAAFPSKGIVPNRAFHAFSQCKDSLSGFLFEGLYQNSDGTRPQRPEMTSELITLSAPIKAAGKPIYVIDYCMPHEIALAQTVATKIKSAGFRPLVTTVDLEGKVLAS